jgi:oligoribonuclease NrnB/cAMP/cGMP phosphodiesterase (DHH superfamily)
MKRMILYHNDADGKCAAAIAARWQNEDFRAIDVIAVPVNYGEDVPLEKLEVLGEHDSLWIVDFSYPYEQMYDLIEKYGNQMYWFDHHYTALKALAGLEKHNIEGLRSIDYAGCLLVWVFCNYEVKEPLAVQYIADRDVWKFEHGDKTRWFYEKYLQEERTRPDSALWDRYFEMSSQDYELYVREGELLYKARMNGLRAIAKRFGVETEIDGFRCLRVNAPASGDLGQVIKEMGYPVAWIYADEPRDGRVVCVNHVYSETVDVGAIAEARGGGGHKGAAGWVERRKQDSEEHYSLKNWRHD